MLTVSNKPFFLFDDLRTMIDRGLVGKHCRTRFYDRIVMYAVKLLCPLLAANMGVAAPIAASGRYALLPYQIGVIVNSEDANSSEIGDYYRKARRIPARNLVKVSLPGNPHVLTVEAFEKLKQQVDKSLDKRVQAIVLIWTAPYAVECNSITSALTMGLDTALCSSSCGKSRLNPYFDSASTRPYTDFGMRISMLLPTYSVALAHTLIDKGIRSDRTRPSATAYLLTTSDPLRNSRAAGFPSSGSIRQPPLKIENLKADSIENKNDVMFYFTGATNVAQLDSLTFLPGALADHLTSAGGQLLDSPQMSSLRWIKAGATASYGTVSEPCNYPQKFPYPAVAMKHYLLGASALEAYWKSVAWPAQGVFIGEPLAAPYQR